jgi:hypothetical protein
MLAARLDDLATRSRFRALWQEMLLTTMDREGVTFTFDLPVLLVNEAIQRGLPVNPDLQEYTDRLMGLFEKWGTRMRFQSARAADLYHRGQSGEADERLGIAASEAHGYAGFATGHLMAIANRWLEFGRPRRVEQPLTPWTSETLNGKLASQVGFVRDADFREQLTALVGRYNAWHGEPEAPETDTGLAELRSLQDEHARNVYVDYLSARWSWPPQAANVEGLKALLPLVLDSGTLLDLVLARLLRAYLASDPEALNAPELAEAQEIVYRSLATARPWEWVHGAQIG